MDVEDMSNFKLMEEYAKIVRELQVRKLVETTNRMMKGGVI